MHNDYQMKSITATLMLLQIAEKALQFPGFKPLHDQAIVELSKLMMQGLHEGIQVDPPKESFSGLKIPGDDK